MAPEGFRKRSQSEPSDTCVRRGPGRRRSPYKASESTGGPGNEAAKWPDSGGGGQQVPGGGGLGARTVKGIPCWVVSALF